MTRRNTRARGLALAAAAFTCACERSFDCTSLYAPLSTTVMSTTSTWLDPQRTRTLPIRIHRATEATEPKQLLIFSSGLDPAETDHDDLGRFLAARGYTVVVLFHPESLAKTACGAVQGAECWKIIAATEVEPNALLQRIADLEFAITYARTHESDVGLIDPDRIAVGGFSFGSFTALTLVGTTFTDPRTGQRIDARNAGIRAAFAMAPQGPRWYGLDERSWSTVDRPVLFIVGDRDASSRPLEPAAWRRIPFDRIAEGEHWMLRLANAGHMSFTNREDAKYLLDLQQRVVLAFLDTYVRADTRARKALSDSQVRACSKGTATLLGPKLTTAASVGRRTSAARR